MAVKVSPHRSFDAMANIVKFCARCIGVDFSDPNYKVNIITVLAIMAILMFFSFSFMTIIIEFSTDWTIALQVLSTTSNGAQGVAKLISTIIYARKYYDVHQSMEGIYLKYQQKGENYRQKLQECVAKCKRVMKIFGLIYLLSCIVMVGVPLFLFVYNGQRHLMIPVMVPGFDISTDYGYYCTLGFQTICVYIGAFGFYAGDLYVVICFTHAGLFADILSLKREELNAIIEEGNQDVKVINAIKDMIAWHQFYYKFAADCDTIFHWVVTTLVFSTSSSVIFTLFVVLTKYWPAGYAYIIWNMCTLYLYCILGTSVEISNDKVCDEMYNISWYDLKVSDKKLVLLMLQQSQQPYSINVAGVMLLSVNTGLSVKRLYLMALLCALSTAQDYQDYQENVPQQRPAPIRLRPATGHVAAARPTPVAILKQINKHNEDGSYTYGYEGADGSFKIETKLATGEVKGKYGYVDETGKVRVVEYGANQYGFQPSGEGITVAPPTLVDETAKEEPDYEDEPVRPQRPFRLQRPQQASRVAPPPPPPQPRPQPQYVQYAEAESEPEPPRRPQYAPAPQSVAPAPPRLQVPGAQRSTDVVYSPLQRPVRPEPDYSQSQNFGAGPSNVRISRPVYASAPVSPSPSSARAHGFIAPASGGRPILEPLQFGPTQTPLQRPAPQAIPVQEPQPQSRYQPQPQPQPHPQLQGRNGGGGGSLLDQLARDYALPQSNSQPLHDISFGYY